MNKNQPMNKRCGHCKMFKALVEFGPNTWRKDGLRNACKTCESSTARAKRKTNPRQREIDRKFNLRRNFGITQKDYERMLINQSGVCAICGHPETAVDRKSGAIKRLSVDHCAETGIIRSLLCGKCNVGIGYFRHSITLLESAISYLQKPYKSRTKQNEHQSVKK